MGSGLGRLIKLVSYPGAVMKTLSAGELVGTTFS